METSNNQNQSEFENSINARPVTESEKNYRDGYYQGKREADRLQIEKTTVNEGNTSAGLLIGFVLAILAALGLAALFMFGGNNQPTEAINDSTINETVEPAEPEKETTIIERTIEKTQEVVPVPQAQPVNPTPIQSESKPIENSINIPITTESDPSDENTSPEIIEKELPEKTEAPSNQESNQNETQLESTP